MKHSFTAAFQSRHYRINCHGGEVVMDILDNSHQWRRFVGPLDEAISWAIDIWDGPTTEPACPQSNQKQPNACQQNKLTAHARKN